MKGVIVRLKEHVMLLLPVLAYILCMYMHVLLNVKPANPPGPSQSNIYKINPAQIKKNFNKE